MRHVWHEALSTLNELLIKYEKINAETIEAEEKYRLLFENALVGMFQVSPDGRPIIVNRTTARLYGYESARQFLDEVLNVKELISPEQLSQCMRAIGSGEVVSAITVEVRCRDGEIKWASINLRAVCNSSGKLLYFEGTAEDVTDKKSAGERIQYLAYYDSLTGLPNSTLFNLQLDQALVSARARKRKVALLLLELDRFKLISDSFGRVFGDHLLQECAERLKKACEGIALVARLGSGEFAILPNAVRGVSDAGAVARKVSSCLSAKFSILGHTLSISCNVGISIFPENGQDGSSLLQNAEVALYASKEDGPSKSRFFTKEMNAQILEQLTLENDLRLAVDRKELFLLYQPQINIHTNKITGLEALIRWQHPRLGLIPPGSFIGVAESSGLIVPIGAWVLENACAQAKRWQQEGLAGVPVAVNVSAVQIRQQGFAELVRNVLRETGLEPGYLELELTESLLLTNADVIFSILQKLRDMGVRLAIDDFGTGYSSLSYLRQFHVNRLKIDRSFIRDVAVNRDDAAITTAIIEMAKALNLEVLAEGVENEAQLSFLRGQKCHEIQGFYFSKPETVERIYKNMVKGSIIPACA
jgi:diguanylate cyclase (GGDEF)-like protein/PAS domain S-box-containing protein